jgi:hypothetical protein
MSSQSSVVTPTEIATNVMAAWEKYIAPPPGAVSQQPRANVWASQWRPCDRRMVYDLIGAPRLPLPADVQARMRRGSDRERDLLIDMARVGRFAEPQFDVIGQQEHFQLRDRKGRVAISGKVDARLTVEGARAPLEVKTWSPFVVDRIETFEDVFESPWTRTGGFQLLAYLFGAAEPFGFLLLDRAGLPKLIPVELDPHLDRMEDFLARAERALDHRDAGTMPNFLDDSDECKRCDYYGHTCNPPLSADVTQVLTDPELEAAIARREELKRAGKEYLDLDAQIKKQLRGIEHAVIGPFVIEGKWGKQTRVDLPADLKKQYTITDPKGRFTLEITKVL